MTQPTTPQPDEIDEIDDHPTPAKVWDEMRRGNARFINGVPRHPRQDVEHRHQLAKSQRPRAALFGCSDSRLAAEIIFDKGLGDLFVVRNAGQVISESALGSLEYAVAVLDVSVVVVLAHDECGAVRAAIDSVGPHAKPLPVHIQGLIDVIIPSVRRVAAVAAARSGSIPTVSESDGEAVGQEHLRDTVTALLLQSEIISDAVAAGTLAIVGANYRLADGLAQADIVIGNVTLPAPDQPLQLAEHSAFETKDTP